MNETRRVTLQAASRRVEPRVAGSIASSFRSLLRLSSAASLAAALACPFVARSAAAQEWLKDRAAAEGAGVRVGDFELHPGIGAQGGYDSNWFLRTDKSGFSNSGVQGTPEMLITPSLSLATLGGLRKEGSTVDESPPVTFRTSVSGTYREYFGQLSPEQRNGSIDASANLGILPGREWGGALAVFYDRLIQPSSLQPSDPNLSFTRDVVGGSADLAFQPGGGTLDWHVGAQASGTLFEETGGQGYNNFGVSGYTRGRWKFRPKTALLYDATLSFNNYSNVAAGDGTITALHSSDPVRTHLGINGLLTPRLSFLALVGYGGSFFTPASSPEVKQYDSVIAQSELKIYLTAPPGDPSPAAVSLSQSSLAFGYTRDFQTNYLSDFNGLDRGYLKFSYFFAGRALISLEGGGAAIEYPTLFFPASSTGGKAATVSSFTDARIDATLFGEYRFTNSFALNATVRYTTNLSNTVLPIFSPEEFSMQWQRVEAYLGVRLFL